ncbi:MAG: lipoyl synthase [candidate division WOR-3 bacterium]
MPRPAWLKTKLPTGEVSQRVSELLAELRLHTVCVSARCPNRGECWGRGTATFMILGETCTRRCLFCGVTTGNPKGIWDETEPQRIASAVRAMGLRYVVVTSVDRDDLADLGAGAFAATIRAIRGTLGQGAAPRVEVLTPDFAARPELLVQVLEARPDVFAHNLETVEALTPLVRDRRASYRQSLLLLAQARMLAPGLILKSGFMLGLGETKEQVIRTLEDIRSCGVDVVTIGQYLRPSRANLPVVEYVSPAQFAEYGQRAREMGFSSVQSGPLVRSSYHAETTHDALHHTPYAKPGPRA